MSSPRALNTVVMALTSLQAETLITPVLGMTLAERQLQLLVNAGIHELIFFLPLTADKCRELLRTLATRYPVRLVTLPLNPKFSLYTNVVTYCRHLPGRWLWGCALDFGLGFAAEQLSHWQGDVIVEVSAQSRQETAVPVQIESKYVTSFWQAQTREDTFATGNLLLTPEYTKTWPEVIATRQDWIDLLDEQARTGVVKACEVTSSLLDQPVWPENADHKTSAQFCADWAKIWLREHQPVIAQMAQIAPTARLLGPVSVAPGVEIGEYTVLRGPIYLGERVKVGDFARLEGCIIEAESIIDPYSNLSGRWLPVGSQPSKRRGRPSRQ